MSPSPERGSNRPSALVLCALGLGDLCAAVPALRALRRGLPHRLALATPASLAPLVALGGLADELVPVGSLDDAWDARLGPVDLAVNLHGPGPQSWRLLDDLPADRRVGFHRDAAPRWREDEPERERWCRLVREAMALPADPADVRIDPHPSWRHRPERIVVHPGAAAPARRWPPERFAAVVRHLVDAGLPVSLTGGRDEVELARSIAGAVPDHLRADVAVLAGTTDLSELCRTVASARLVICGDTGVGHLATAFGRPSVLLFGPTDPRRWGPPPGGPHQVLWAGREGDPHAQRPDPGLLEIATEDVLAAVDAQLADASPWAWTARVR